MKSKTGKKPSNINKYDASIALLIVFAAIFILGVWIWFGHKNAEVDKELSNLKSFLNN